MQSITKIIAAMLAISATCVFACSASAAASSGKLQGVADAFVKCDAVNANVMSSELIMTIGATPKGRAAWINKYASEVSGTPSYKKDGDYTTVSVKPLDEIRFAGVKVDTVSALTCNGGDCGTVIYLLEFGSASAADKAMLKAAVAKAPRSGHRPKLIEQKGQPVSVMCDVGD